jgi:hypothetical protein
MFNDNTRTDTETARVCVINTHPRRVWCFVGAHT